MKTILILSVALGASVNAFATTKIRNPGQPSTSLCQVRAKFINASADRLSFKRRGVEQSSALVFWNLEVLDVSNPQICPEGRNISIRVRACDFNGPKEKPNLTCPVHIQVPNLDEVVNLKIRFLEGRDSFSGRDYKEWTLLERTND